MRGSWLPRALAPLGRMRAGAEVGTGQGGRDRNPLCSHKTRRADLQEETLHPQSSMKIDTRGQRPRGFRRGPALGCGQRLGRGGPPAPDME